MGRGMFVVLIGLLAATPCLAGEGCGAPATPCSVASGTYFAATPPWHEGDPLRPAVLFLHGAGGSGASAIADPVLAGPIVARGYALLAPNGSARPDRDGAYWSLGARPPVRDEDGFLEQILADAAPRFHLDRSRVFVTGFSMGAGLVWQLACRNPAAFAAYGPIAGGFWNGSPKACAGPVRLLLTHGWRDDAVPIEGWEHKPDLVEGGAFDGAQLWRRVNGCPDAHAGKLRRRRRVLAAQLDRLCPRLRLDVRASIQAGSASSCREG